MNQMGFVEVSLVKNDRLYRVVLPMGVSWLEAKQAVLELADQIASHIAECEAAQLAKDLEESASVCADQVIDAETPTEAIE